MGDNHILPTLGAVKLSKLTSPQIQKFYNGLAKDRTTEIIKDGQKVKVDQKALSAKTIRNIHGYPVHRAKRIGSYRSDLGLFR